jgi:RHS repeat-associated protein
MSVLYGCQDGNWNLTSVVDTTGVVQERYEYDAYGVTAILSDEFVVQDESGYDWETTYAGYRCEGGTGLFAVRNRFYQPQIGGWISRDPIEFQGGTANLFEYIQSSPANDTDSFGLGGPAYCGAASMSVIPDEYVLSPQAERLLQAEEDRVRRILEEIKAEKAREEYFRTHTITKVYRSENEIQADSLTRGPFQRTRQLWALINAIGCAPLGPARGRSALSPCPTQIRGKSILVEVPYPPRQWTPPPYLFDPNRTLNDPLPPHPQKPTQANPFAPHPEATGRFHTVIGTRTEPTQSPAPYFQGITYNERGYPLGRIDVTTHGRGDHPCPHYHHFDPTIFNKFDPFNPGNFGPAGPLPH